MIPEELHTWSTRVGAALAVPARELAPSSAAPARRRAAPRRVAVTLAAALGAVAVITGMPSHRPASPATASAAQVLEHAAHAAGAARAPRVGEFMYVKLAYEFNAAGHSRGVIERWVARSGAGLEEDHPATSGGRATHRRLARSRAPFVVAGRHLSYAQLNALGRSGGRLDALIGQAAASEFPASLRSRFPDWQRRAYAAYTVLRDLATAPAAPALRRALYLRLATAPGLKLRQRGAASATISSTVGDVRFELTLDPEKGNLISLRRYLERRSWQIPGAPRLVSEARILSSGTVDHVGQRP